MAVPRRKTSPSRRGMRRSHDAIAAPTYVEEGVIHYCVTNMPGAVPRTSAFALNNATLPFVLALAEKGWRKAVADDPHLANGVNVVDRKLTSEAVARSLDLAYTPLRQAMA